ncbi:uncharacterized protein BJX67DRAFT_166012 [Aspergillus lucknowensis]|uniref:Roadblock/LAMTOR2 domain-containing protein n=1 Tax=Aspergillus lucknowensis TaxID=176173 RepID=A0ABR4M4P1_9EURO
MMANSMTSPQVPQHVSALLSHLTSRPGVQSTFILSRKDGSIIQSTGLLAPPKRTRSETSSPTPTAAPSATEDNPAAPPSATSPANDIHTSSSTTQQQKLYQPSQAETLAAHIFAFVSSASNLGLSLSHPVGDGASPDSNANSVLEGGLGDAGGGGTTGREDGAEEGEGSEAQDDDEVKLLRLRTKKHEIVVVPDKKYLLCVVHDATANASGGSSAALATGVGGRLGR